MVGQGSPGDSTSNVDSEWLPLRASRWASSAENNAYIGLRT